MPIPLKRTSHIARVLVWITAFAALIPLARLIADWVEVSRVITGPGVEAAGRGFDWVLWQEDDGVIYASYVYPRGPAAEGGIQEGDLFFMLEYQQYFNAEDLKRAIDGIEPGTRRTYFVQRDGEFLEADVQFTRYPTFLYPLSGTLWHFSIWGFLVAAFVHLVGLVIVGPLSFRSRKARFSLLLILVSSLWIFSNLIRLLMVEVFGPPLETGSPFDLLFQTLTGLGLIGWIGFPALLVHKVLGDTYVDRSVSLRAYHVAVYLPAAVLGLTALVTTLRGSLGPITIDGLVAPILFYACCYVATAAALMLLHLARRESEEVPAAWNRAGSGFMLILALLFALSVLGILPLFGAVAEVIAGWLIVSVQLLFVAPVGLVSHATLQHGKMELVLSRGLTYLLASGIIFFAFVGGLSLLDPYLQQMGASRTIVSGLLAVVMVVGFEWVIRRFRGYGMSFFAGERRQMYHAVQQLQEQMRTILDYETLVQRAVAVVGRSFGTRSAVIFLRPVGTEDQWITASYHPEPPYLTERAVSSVWPHLLEEGKIWARNPELNETDFPDQIHQLLLKRGVAVLVPIMGERKPVGVIALGLKKRRRTVYNLEEIDLLRSLSGQLALAVERLNLVEREKALVRESAEAQLAALRAQINPHFLFNSLNTIVSLIEERPEEAEEVVEHLAAIFRYILQTGGRAFVSMEDEFELIHHYLSIEQSRFGASLVVEQHLDPDLRQHPVPAFAVQTLIENAVKHGLGKRRGGGTISLRCTRSQSAVQVSVSDTGVGIPDLFSSEEGVTTQQSFFGIGLKNVASRLEQLYGRPDLLRISSSPQQGTVVTIQLPEEGVARNGSDDDRRDGDALEHGGETDKSAVLP